MQEALEDLHAAIRKHGFGVLHSYDLKATLASKGFDLPHDCFILEVCNPQQAVNVLSVDMGMNIALPCRISVYEEHGRTKIGMARPATLLEALSESQELRKIASEVEGKMLSMIDEAA